MNSDNSFRPGHKCADDLAAAYADAAEFAQLLETSSLGTPEARAAREFGSMLLAEHRLEISTHAENLSPVTSLAELERLIAAQFETNGQVDQAKLWYPHAVQPHGDMAPQPSIDAKAKAGPITGADLTRKVTSSPKSKPLLVTGVGRGGRGRHRAAKRKVFPQHIIPIIVLTASAAMLVAGFILWTPRSSGELETARIVASSGSNRAGDNHYHGDHGPNCVTDLGNQRAQVCVVSPYENAAGGSSLLTPVNPEVQQTSSLSIPGDDLTFITDVTYSDGSSVRVNEQFIKTWEIRNTGSVIWQGRYLTRQATQDAGRCSSPDRVSIPTTQPGQTVQISVTFAAPSSPGSCRVDWKMTNANGGLFLPNKNPIYLLVNVIQ